MAVARIESRPNYWPVGCKPFFYRDRFCLQLVEAAALKIERLQLKKCFRVARREDDFSLQ